MARVMVIGTVETKAEAIAFLCRALDAEGMETEILDVSLKTEGLVLGAPEKLALIARRGAEAAQELAARRAQFDVAIGLGGGTGGEIVIGALKGLPAAFPKMLVTTLPADPRGDVADSAITLVPTLCDIEGMNGMLAQVFTNAAAMAAGLARARHVAASGRPVIALTTLGVTAAASRHIADLLAQQGREPTVFHANGFGGAAFTRFVREGRAAGVIDLNVHELGRMRLAGAHVAMPGRFTAAGGLPRVVLPGGLNFLGLGTVDTVPDALLGRPHYRHSGHFTHVKLSTEEMADQAAALAETLNASTAPTHVIVPMGGFSSQDAPGGAIEDPDLRDIAAQTLEAQARAFRVTRLPAHINDAATADAVTRALDAAFAEATTRSQANA